MTATLPLPRDQAERLDEEKDREGEGEGDEIGRFRQADDEVWRG